MEEVRARMTAVGLTSAGEEEPLQVAILEVTEALSVVVATSLGAGDTADKGPGGRADVAIPRAMAAVSTGARGTASTDQATPALPTGTAQRKPSPRSPRPRPRRGKLYRLWLR